MARCLNEADTLLRIGEVVTGEVVRFEKQEHSTAALIADRLTLPVADSPCQQQSRRRAVRRDHDPPLIICQRGVLTQLEAKLSDEEGESNVIFVDEKGSQVQALGHSMKLPQSGRQANVRFLWNGVSIHRRPILPERQPADNHS